MVYFDHNSTEEMLSSVKSGMIDFILKYKAANPSSFHSIGQNAKNFLEELRFSICKSVASGYSAIFTPNATIANNLILKSFDKTIVSSVEHKSIYCKDHFAIASVDSNCYIDKSVLIDLIKNIEKPFLVSIIHAQNELGVINDIQEIASIVHNYGGFLHTDASQSFGKIIKDLSVLNADFITVSGHKIGGGYGAGCLFYKIHNLIKPLFLGGMQEFGLCSGTENIISILSLKLAIDNINIENYSNKTLCLRNLLDSEIEKFGGIILCKNSKRLPNTSMIVHKFLSSESQVMSFDMNGFCVGIGSACSSGAVKKSQILSSIGFAENIVNNSIRISFGIDNTLEEVKSFINLWNSFDLRVKK